MNGRIQKLAATAALALLFSNAAEGGDGGVSKPLNNGNVEIQKNGKASHRTLPQINLVGTIAIKSFTTNRFTGGLAGVIVSTAPLPVEAFYTVYRWNGKSWTTLKSDMVVVPPQKTAAISIPFRRGPDAETLQMVVINNAYKAHDSKRLTLAALPKTVFVCKYRTNGWVVVADQSQKGGAELIGGEAPRRRPTAHRFGFRTEIHKTTTTNLLGSDTYRTMAYARLDQPIERAFDTIQERDEFARKIAKLVPAFGRDQGTGLNLSKFQR